MAIEAYDHPALTADVVLFALGRDELNVLLIQRGKPPFQGSWAFPGGFVNVGESPLDAASRELWEETGIREVRLEQLRVFGDPDRDPRGHVITVAFLAVVAQSTRLSTEASSDADQLSWWSLDQLPPLAFDHAEILTHALQRLHCELACTSPPHSLLHMLPGGLSLGDLRAACRTVAENVEIHCWIH
jgi:8-oxo-dGTP diphosphatase